MNERRYIQCRFIGGARGLGIKGYLRVENWRIWTCVVIGVVVDTGICSFKKPPVGKVRGDERKMRKAGLASCHQTRPAGSANCRLRAPLVWRELSNVVCCEIPA